MVRISATTADTAETIFHRPGTASSVTRAQNHQNATMDKPAAQDAAAPVRIIPAQISPVTAGMEQDRQHGKHVMEEIVIRYVQDAMLDIILTPQMYAHKIVLREQFNIATVVSKAEELAVLTNTNTKVEHVLLMVAGVLGVTVLMETSQVLRPVPAHVVAKRGFDA